MPLIGNLLKPLAKNVVIPLRLTAAAATAAAAAAAAKVAAVYKKMFGSGSGYTTLMISNEEMNDIMKIVNSLEESGLLIKPLSEAIKNEAK